jgi:hypothetical protein
MLLDLDESVRTLLRTYGRVPKDVDLVFDAPTKDWASRRSGPAVDVFLYDIRENLDRRQAVSVDVRAGDRVTGRRLPTRWFNCSYLITAWTQRPDDEHRILGSIMMGLLVCHAVPPDCLRGRLALQEREVYLTLARPLAAERSISDIWSALGGELKPSLDLVLVVPFEPEVDEVVGPPVLEAPSLFIGGNGELPEQTGPRLPGHRRAKPQVDRNGLAPARTAGSNGDDELQGEHEELRGGTPEQPGRRFRFGVMEPPRKIDRP